MKLLQELNPDVKGEWFPKNKVSFTFFRKRGYNMIGLFQKQSA